MPKEKIIYRGELASRQELIGKLLQLQRLGQMQGRQIHWEDLEDYIIAENEPKDWLDEEMTELEDLIKGDS